MGRIYESQCLDCSVLFPSPPSISIQSRQLTADQCQKDICTGEAVCVVLCLELWICTFARHLLPKGMLKAEFCQSLTQWRERQVNN